MRGLVSFAIIVLVLTTSGCGGSKDVARQQYEEILAVYDSISESLAGVKDEATANAAVPKIKESIEKFKKLRETATTIKVPSSTLDEVSKEYAPKIDKAGIKLGDEIKRVMAIPKGKVAADEAMSVLSVK